MQWQKMEPFYNEDAEQVFLGHVFASPPHAQFVQGVDSTSVLSLNSLTPRRR